MSFPWRRNTNSEFWLVYKCSGRGWILGLKYFYLKTVLLHSGGKNREGRIQPRELLALSVCCQLKHWGNTFHPPDVSTGVPVHFFKPPHTTVNGGEWHFCWTKVYANVYYLMTSDFLSVTKKILHYERKYCSGHKFSTLPTKNEQPLRITHWPTFSFQISFMWIRHFMTENDKKKEMHVNSHSCVLGCWAWFNTLARQREVIAIWHKNLLAQNTVMLVLTALFPVVCSTETSSRHNSAHIQ